MFPLLDPLQGVNAVDQARGRPLTREGPACRRCAIAQGDRRTHVRMDDLIRAFSALLKAGQSEALKAPVILLLRSVSDRGTAQTESGSGDLAVDLGASLVRNACFTCLMQARDRRDTGARGKLSRGENTVVKKKNCAQVTKRLKIARTGTP